MSRQFLQRQSYYICIGTYDSTQYFSYVISKTGIKVVNFYVNINIKFPHRVHSFQQTLQANLIRLPRLTG